MRPIATQLLALLPSIAFFSACAGSGGLVERNVRYPKAGGTSKKALVLMPIEITSGRTPLQIPDNAQVAITYTNSKGTTIKTQGVDNDGPSIALLIAPGAYQLVGLDAIATMCPDGRVRTTYNQFFREAIPFDVAPDSVSYIGRLRISTRCFKKYTGRTIYKQQGNSTVGEKEFFWTVEFLGARRSPAFQADLPALKQAYPNVSWDTVEVHDKSGPRASNG
ncbi:MAG: hypothetical protein JKY56_06355 [Kofleriaceae bacterium]|nr:hypothetical protein [Kofleriaceae bacterium]